MTPQESLPAILSALDHVFTNYAKLNSVLPVDIRLYDSETNAAIRIVAVGGRITFISLHDNTDHIAQTDINPETGFPKT